MGRLKRHSIDIKNSPVSSQKLSELVIKIEEGVISGNGAKVYIRYFATAPKCRI